MAEVVAAGAEEVGEGSSQGVWILGAVERAEREAGVEVGMGVS